MTDIITETSRLQLRKITPDDAPFFVQLVNTPGWLKFIGDRNVHTPADAIAYLEKGVFKSYRENGYGHWIVELRSDATPIGMCGFMKRETLPGPDIGFAYLPEYEGHGYAAEAAMATLKFARKKLQMEIIYAIALEENKASVKLLQKIGMQFQRMIISGDPPEEFMLFMLSKADSTTANNTLQ